MKKAILISMVLIMIFLSFAGCDNKKDNNKTTVPDSGKVAPASDFEYTLRKDGGITISKYIGTDKNVIIPSEIEDRPVTVISSFSTDVESVKIPDSVTLIADNAFYCCSSLKEVSFGKELKEIGNQAFFGCISLTEIKLPENLTSIGSEAFACCSYLKKVFIPKSLEVIKDDAFAYDAYLESITFEDGLRAINGNGMFTNAVLLKEVTIPSSVTCIEYSFIGCISLKTVRFLGDAPAKLSENVFGSPSKEITIYYDKNTSGWDNTVLSEWYNLVAY